MRITTISVLAFVFAAFACKRQPAPTKDEAPKTAAFEHAAAQHAETSPSNTIDVWMGLDGVRASIDGPLLGTFHRQVESPDKPMLVDGIDTSELEPALEKLSRQVDASNAEVALHVDARAERGIVAEVLSLVARNSSRPIWLVVGDGHHAIPVRGIPPVGPQLKNGPSHHPGPTLSDDPDLLAWQLQALAGVDAGPPPTPKPKTAPSAAPSASAAPAVTPTCGAAPLDASITVRGEGYFVHAFGAQLGPDCTHAGEGPTVPPRGELDGDALTSCLARLKACHESYARESTVTIFVRDGRNFQSLVRTLDAVYPSFTTIRIRAL